MYNGAMLLRLARPFLFCAAVLAACGSDDAPEGRSTGVLGAPGDDAGPTSTADGGTKPADGGGGGGTDAGDAALGPEYTGEATYYDADGTGACGFPASNDFMVAAINDEQYSKANCGKCVEVTGPNGTVVVRIVDKCPGCDSGDLDLSQTAFSKIAKLSAGRVKITWHFVACP